MNNNNRKQRGTTTDFIHLIALSLACVLAFVSLPVRAFPGIVIEADTGTVLRHEDANQSWYPASLTKLMTLYLAFDALRTGQLRLNDPLTTSQHAASQPPSRLGLRTGEKITVEKAIKAIATVSANDAAVVMAERLGGSEDQFAGMMTRQANQLGMNNTTFLNASGLPHPFQKTTAAEMALLARHLIRTFPEYFHYFSNRWIHYRGRRRTATNSFMPTYRGADGLKTGYTCGSGYNLIATAQRDQVRLIAVVLGAESRSDRNTRMRVLLDQGFTKVSQLEKSSTIAEFVSIREAGLAAPPYRLNSRACNASKSQFVMKEGALPGWGILLGIQKGKRKATWVVENIRGELEKIKIFSTPALLKRQFQNDEYWKMLLVGLEKNFAGEACRYLLSKSINCVIQSPGRMNSTGYSLR